MRCVAKSLSCLWDFLRLFVALFNGQQIYKVVREKYNEAKSGEQVDWLRNHKYIFVPQPVHCNGTTH